MKVKNIDVESETLELFSLTHNYNKWLIQKIAPWVKGRILEVGCGIGNLTSLIPKQDLLVSIDVSNTYIEDMKKKYCNIRNFQVFKHDIVEGKNSKLRKFRFRTVICSNVLEHIQKEDKALKNLLQILESGGRLILLVPALKSLFVTLDVSLGHHRRYAKRELKQRLEKNGFVVEKCLYLNLLGIVGWFLNGKIFKRQMLSANQVFFYDKLIPFIKVIEKVLGPPIGLSLIFVCRKPS